MEKSVHINSAHLPFHRLLSRGSTPIFTAINVCQCSLGKHTGPNSLRGEPAELNPETQRMQTAMQSCSVPPVHPSPVVEQHGHGYSPGCQGRDIWDWTALGEGERLCKVLQLEESCKCGNRAERWGETKISPGQLTSPTHTYSYSCMRHFLPNRFWVAHRRVWLCSHKAGTGHTPEKCFCVGQQDPRDWWGFIFIWTLSLLH